VFYVLVDYCGSAVSTGGNATALKGEASSPLTRINSMEETRNDAFQSS